MIGLCLAFACDAAAQQQREHTSENSDAVRWMHECIDESADRYQAFSSCIGAITDECLMEASGRIPGLECYDLEAAVWEGIYASGSDQLFQLLEEVGTHSGASGLQETLDAWERSLWRQCAYLSGRWGDGTERQDDNYQCVRDAVAERAITLIFWLEHASHAFNGD